MTRIEKPLASAGRANQQGASNDYSKDTPSSPVDQGEGSQTLKTMEQATSKTTIGCISYYQISRTLGVPYTATIRLLEAGLSSIGCITTTGACGITESEFKLFQEKYRIRRTVNGRWGLILAAQQTLPGL